MPPRKKAVPTQKKEPKTWEEALAAMTPMDRYHHDGFHFGPAGIENIVARYIDKRAPQTWASVRAIAAEEATKAVDGLAVDEDWLRGTIEDRIRDHLVNSDHLTPATLDNMASYAARNGVGIHTRNAHGKVIKDVTDFLCFVGICGIIGLAFIGFVVALVFIIGVIS